MSLPPERGYLLEQYGNTESVRKGQRPKPAGVLVLPEPIEWEKVSAAWAYALQHTARGLDVPDHEAAIKLLVDRQPQWQVIPVEHQLLTITPKLRDADNDIPDTQAQ